MSKNNNDNIVGINKGMFVIIVILVVLLVMFAIYTMVIYKNDTKSLTGKTDNTLSDSSKGNSSVCKSTIGLDDRIKLLGSVKELDDKYKDYYLMVCTSRHEGLPMALIDAKFAKLPIISFNIILNL